MTGLFDIVNSQRSEDEIIELLIQTLNGAGDADINAVDDQGWTVLHRAVSKNQLNTVKFLLEKGADVTAKNGNGLSTSILAARNLNWSILKWLVEARGAEIPMIDEQNRDQVEATIKKIRNNNAISILNDQKDAVLILGQSDSAVNALTEFLTKYDRKTCICLRGDQDATQTEIIPPTVIVDGETDVLYHGSVIGSENPSDDIASSFFLKEIIDYVEEIKIIFSLNYVVVKNQKDLLKFVLSAAKFFVDLSKFNRSVGLIVTKFEDDAQEDEDTILYDVANSLKELKQYLQSKKDETFGEEPVQLLDIFLARFAHQEDYVHLGVFQVSKMANKIISEYHGSTPVQVVKNLWFTLKDEGDFRYTISEESKSLVYDLIERINIGVTFDVIDVANDLQKYYNAEVNQAKNLHKLQKSLNLQSQALKVMAQEIILMPDPNEVANTIVKHIDEMDISLPVSSLKSIKHWGSCMEFLQIAADQTYQATTWNWVNSITDVSRYLDDINKWYEFLLDLYEKFSTYEMQKDKSKYDVANLSDWGKANARRGITINQNNWKQFLAITRQYQVKHYDQVKDMRADRLKLKDLNHVLDLSFKKNAEISCAQFKRIVRGNYVFLSDILNNPCYKNAYYEVFALNTAFIDVNLDQCNLKGVIIAPKWEIIGSKVLGLKAEGQFVGISREFVNVNNFNMYFTKGNQNFQRVNMIENGTKISISSKPQIFSNALACVEKERLSNLEQISYNIDDYKSYLRENLNDNVQQQALVEFVRNFEQSSSITDLYDSLGFVRELQRLEDHYYNLSSQIDFLPFYQSLLARLTVYVEKLKPADNTSQRKILLTYVFAGVLSKINTMKYGSNSNLVIDLKEYLDLLSENIKELGEIEKQALDTSKKFDEINKRAKVEQLRKDYVSEIYKKIDEANYFIKEYILPEIKSISDQLEQELLELLKEIDDIKEQVEERKEQLEKIKKKIEKQIALRAALGIFRIFASILNFFGPIGMIAGAAVNAVIGVAEAFIPDSSEELAKLEEITLPEGIDVERNLRKRTAEDVSDGITSVGDSITSLISNAKSDEQRLEIVKDAIKQSEQQIRQLEDFKTYVRNKVTPWLKNVIGNLQSQAKNLQGKSHVALEVATWQLQTRVKDLKFHLVDTLKGFKVQRKFKRCIEKIEDALNTLVNIFDRIQDYEDQKRLADYIADISSIQYGDHDVKELSLRNMTDNLERIITSNILLGSYDAAVNNFKQFTFPFADYYLEDFSISSVLTADRNVQTLVDNAVRRIALMKSTLTQSSSTINKHIDSYLHKAHFNNKVVGAFYIWNHNEYREYITNLLKGEEIALKADIMQTTSDKNAVKFDSIGLEFQAVNASKQIELESKLKYFEISMTHRGTSYYRCGSKFYIINTDSLTVTYSLQKDNDGKPLSTNLVYEKLSRGDVLLSPYAMWTIKLTPTTLPFKELKKYAHEIDLVLVGHGQYLSRNCDVCDQDLSKHYQVDETLSEVNFVDVPQHTVDFLRNLDDQYMCVSSASSLSSPLNNLIKWFLSGWSQTTWSGGESNFASHFEVNPVEFYSQVDSALALAPVFLHLWSKFFNRKFSSGITEVTEVDVLESTITEWKNILGLSRKLLDSLENVLGSDHSGLKWYTDTLDSRVETFEKIRAQKKVGDVIFDDLQKNLFVFYEDLSEDLKYDPMFAEAIRDESVQVAVNKLAVAFRASPIRASRVEHTGLDDVIPVKPIYMQGVKARVNEGQSGLGIFRIGNSKAFFIS